MGKLCKIIGHKVRPRTLWLGQEGYPVYVLGCKRCDHIEDLPTNNTKEGE